MDATPERPRFQIALYSKVNMDLSVRLLGKPALRFEGQWLEPAGSKSMALLWYVAHAESWVPREDLLYLLWPDMPESRARNNLRQHLYQVGNLNWTESLEREPQRVRWDVDSDLARFRSALHDDSARDAVDAYGGSLLEGFPAGTAPEFDAWLDVERELLHRSWRKACHTESERLRAAGRSLEAAELLERVQRQDPLDEANTRKRMEALVEGGRRTQAQRVFLAFADRLSRELDLEPAPETVRLADSIRSCTRSRAAHANARDEDLHATGHEDGHATDATRKPPPLPVETTEFVGRARELEFLAGAVLQRDVRFLSLVAAGGMGKTRLALALAQRLRTHFADGAASASFVDIEQPERMPGGLADALGLRPSPGTPLREQLLGFLAPLEMVLVLDNLEQLTENLSLLQAIRAHAPNVRLVTTSRERLHVADEWVYDVQGLDAPARSTRHGPIAATEDAVELFLATARRVTGSLTTHEFDRKAVAELCRHLSGMPLAIVLAAGWLRVLSPTEILEELAAGLDVLARPDGPDDDRHRSVETVLDATWRRLRPAERDAWARLSATAGSFDRAAAHAVASAGLPLLLALANKAIVARSEGRFDLHPLVRTYGRKRADEFGVASEVRKSMAEHYLPWFASVAERFKGPDQIDALREATVDMPNVRAAWIAATEEDRPYAIADVAFDLVSYHEISGRLHEYSALVDQTLEAWLGGREPERLEPRKQRAVARLLPWSIQRPGTFRERLLRSSRLAERLGDVEAVAELHLQLAALGGPEWREHAATARRLFEQLGDQHALARLGLAFGWTLVDKGFYQEGFELMRRAASSAARLGDSRLELAALDGMIPVYILLGDLERAEEMVARILDANRELGLMSSQADVLGTLQWLEMEKGNFSKAEEYQDTFFALLERGGGDATSTREFLRAGLRYREGRYEDAEQLATAYLSRRSDAGTGRVTTILTLLVLGRIAGRENRMADARRYLSEATAITKKIASPRFLMDTAVATAELLLLEGKADLARQLLAAAEEDPATEIAVKVEIERLKAQGVEVPPSDSNADRAWLWTVLCDVYGS